jgi:hypothetical protein
MNPNSVAPISCIKIASTICSGRARTEKQVCKPLVLTSYSTVQLSTAYVTQ